MPTYKFIINPVPLNRKKKEFLKHLKQGLINHKIKFSFEYSSKEKNAEQIAKQSAKHGYNIIVACGGDGTIREVVNGIYKTKSALAILPFGTSNDFAKHLGLNSFHKAVVALFEGKRKKIDLGEVDLISHGKKKKILFCSTSGIGFDGRLLKLNESKIFLFAKKFLKNMSYPLAGLFLVFFYKSHHVEIIFGDKKITTRLFMLNANFVKSMSGMKVTPHAGRNNEVFDIFMVEDSNILKKIIGFAWYGVTSKKINFKEVHYISKTPHGSNRFNLADIKDFTVTSKAPIEVQLNGDILGYTPAKFKILPKAVDIII